MSHHISIFFWQNFGEIERITVGHRMYYDYDVQRHVVPIYRHKGILGARPRGTDNQLFAFIPDEGKWIGIEQTSDFRVHEHARYAIVRFSYTRFLPGFGDALTKVYNCTVAGYWPPEQEAEDILIHGVGTRIIRVVFWNRDGSLPLEFAIRMDQGDNIEPVLYDALASRLNYFGEIDIWTVAETTWTRLPKEVPWTISMKYTTACVKALQGVGLTPGLGWEITQLERQHGATHRDVGTDTEGLNSEDNPAN